MLKQLFHQIGRFLGKRNITDEAQSRPRSSLLPVEPTAIHESVQNHSAAGGASASTAPSFLTKSEPRFHSAARPLSDGHLRIAVTGFHDSAFEISPLERSDSAPLSEAVADLPCRVKMVEDRNIPDAMALALNSLNARGKFGRRAIVLVTSGIESSKVGQLIDLASEASARRIGVHVICLGADADTFAAGREICTKHLLGYGYCRAAETPEELDLAFRYALGGLTPVFGMRRSNRATILVDCSETMVASYRDTTRCEMAVGAIQGFLGSPLIKRNQATSSNGNLRNKSEIRGLPSFRSQEAYEWTPDVA